MRTRPLGPKSPFCTTRHLCNERHYGDLPGRPQLAPATQAVRVMQLGCRVYWGCNVWGLALKFRPVFLDKPGPTSGLLQTLNLRPHHTS